MGLAALRVISGSIDIRERTEDFVLDPLAVGPAVVVLVGMLVLWRAGNPLPALVAMPYATLMVIFNAKYEVIPNARFLTPLTPLLFCCSGAAACALWPRRLGGKGVAVAATVLLVAGLASLSVVGLARRYSQMPGSAQTTATLQVAVDSVVAAREPGEAVMLDRNLDRLWLDGGGDLWMALSFEFSRRGVPLGDFPGRVNPPSGDLTPCVRQQLVAVRVDRSGGTPSWLTAAIAPDPGQVPLKFWTFRVVPREVPRDSLPPNEHLVLQYVPPLSGSARAVDRCAPGRLI